MAKKFKCTICGYVHEGDSAPAQCPACGQPASVFEEIKEASAAESKKKGLDTNSNVYTVIYAIVLTVIVAIGLTAAAVGLAPQQKANADNEKKQQVLSAVSPVLGHAVTFTTAADEWSSLDMDNNTFVVNTKGEKVEGVKAFDLVAKQQFKAGIVKEEAQLPVFVANIGEKPYYIMCMYGGGLWDAIWGYIAVEADGSTIAGVTFDHAGETAGLGAKIKDDPKFAEAFVGKKVFVNGDFAPVTVSKKGGDNNVDAITGATKTSDCVSYMVEQSLLGYKAFLQALQGAPAEHKCCGKCQEGEAEGACCGKCQEGAEAACAEAEGCCKQAEGACEKAEGCCGKCNNESVNVVE